MNNISYYVVMCLGMFAARNALSYVGAFHILHHSGALDFLICNYEAEHLLGMDDVVDDLQTIIDRKQEVLQ
ncbi:hypothetical protein AGMMS49965_15040 [Bacteroidia bacterium]|nr:hypothetical protein AGMMS49965_15040 [Bacteroidia bacterium]